MNLGHFSGFFFVFLVQTGFAIHQFHVLAVTSHMATTFSLQSILLLVPPTNLGGPQWWQTGSTMGWYWNPPWRLSRDWRWRGEWSYCTSSTTTWWQQGCHCHHWWIYTRLSLLFLIDWVKAFIANSSSFLLLEFEVSLLISGIQGGRGPLVWGCGAGLFRISQATITT